MPRNKSQWTSAEHSSVEQFKLKELRTQVFDTYAICAALLTTLSASRFFFDNRTPDELITGKGEHATVHLAFLLQHFHLLIGSICTAAGLESMMVFVLCTMYSKSALALPLVGSNIFEYFLKQTGSQRKTAFMLMLTSGVLSSFNLVINCMAMPTFVIVRAVPAVILDVASIVTAVIVFIIACVTVHAICHIMNAANIIFLPISQLDEYLETEEEKTPLLEDIDESPTSSSRGEDFLSRLEKESA